jgi:hypothetical protein
MRFVTVALPVVIALTARAQIPTGAPRPTTQITVTGRVVAAETGDPVPNSRVTVSQPGAGGPVVLTDGDGHFRLSVPTGVTIPYRLVLITGRSQTNEASPFRRTRSRE